MMEFYFPKLKKKVMAKPVSGKAYRARGGSVRYGLQAMHNGAKSLPKYVSRDEYGRLGFSAEQADSELPAYVPKVAYAEEAPVPASPLENAPSALPEPAEPTNANFSAEEIAYAVSWEGKDDNNGLIYGIEYADEDGGVADVEWFSTADKRDDELSRYLEKYGAEIEGVVDYTRRERKDILVEQDVSQSYTVDTDPEDIPENKMDEVEQAIQDEVDGIVRNDPASHDTPLNDISVDTSVEVPDEDGDMVEVSAYGYTDEPMINNEDSILEDTHYESFYSESENSIHQFKGESTSCCDAETYRYKSEGDWLCMACDEFQAEFNPEELAKSSAIHGDFDHASINYSGHQNLLARAETVMKGGVYRTTCDCGTVLKWDEYSSATTKDGTMIRQKDMTVERLDFPSPEFDHFEEELSIECPTCGEHHICMIEAPVYHDRLKVDFGADSLIEEPDFIPEGDGRALGQQNSSINLSPLHAETNSTYEYVMGMIEDLSDDDYTDFCYEMDIDPDDTEELSSFVMSNYDSNQVMQFLLDKGMVKGYKSEGKNYTHCSTCKLPYDPDLFGIDYQKPHEKYGYCACEMCDGCGVLIAYEDGKADDFGFYCNECNIKEAEGMSRNAKMALGFTAIGLGIAAWKGKELVSLFDSLKEQIKKMTDK
jgi:hypothetical protein